MKKIFLLFIPLLLASCVANKPIQYKVDKLASSDVTLPYVLCIKEFTDSRKDTPNAEWQFGKGKQLKKGKKQLCVNSEKHYKKERVASLVSRQIATHFEQIKLFKATTFEDDSQADFYLTGVLTSFYGVQDFSTSAAIGSAFGLIGAMATSGAKSPGDIVMEIKDLTLYDKEGKVIKRLGDYRKEYHEKMPADGYCWCIYENVNKKLKAFNEGLADKIKEEMLSL